MKLSIKETIRQLLIKEALFYDLEDEFRYNGRPSPKIVETGKAIGFAEGSLGRKAYVHTWVPKYKIAWYKPEIFKIIEKILSDLFRVVYYNNPKMRNIRAYIIDSNNREIKIKVIPEFYDKVKKVARGFPVVKIDKILY